MVSTRTQIAVDDWIITYRGQDGKEVSSEVYGKIALQEWWALVLDGDNKVLFATPNCNVIRVEPLAP